MKYDIGDKVRIKSLDWYNANKNNNGIVICNGGVGFTSIMSAYCGKIVTISKVFKDNNAYYIENDFGEFSWTDNMIEGFVEDEKKDMGEISDGYHTFNELYEYRLLYNASMFNELAKQGLYDVHKSKRHSDGEVPFGDSNWFIVMAELPTGQISNHYEMKDWNLFQIPEKEKANKYDGHTPKDVAERIRKFVTPKPKYPITYEECYKIIVEHAGADCNPKGVMGYKYKELETLQKLLICRDAYWKIAGDWKPDLKNGKRKEVIHNGEGEIVKSWKIGYNTILAFPTIEMRDAFYKNFRSIIEECKELL